MDAIYGFFSTVLGWAIGLGMLALFAYGVSWRRDQRTGRGGEFFRLINRKVGGLFSSK